MSLPSLPRNGVRRLLSGDEEGTSLVLIAIAMLALLGMAALAIDVGMLYEAKAQAQNAADSGALAGAGALLVQPGNDANARTVAETFAERHEIIRQQVAIEPDQDIQVDLVNERVTVTARRLTARGNAVPTFFARVLGWDEVDIQATATAEVGNGGAGSCLKPWIVPDAFDDTTAPFGQYNVGDYYEQGVTSWGTNYRNADSDWGTRLTLKISSPSQTVAPGQFYPIDLPIPDGPDAGGDRYRENIYSCNSEVVEINDTVKTENGNMIGPTKQGVQKLIDMDPYARWDTAANGIVNSAFPPGASPRIGHVPFFSPAEPPTSGKQSIRVVNIGAIFIEGISGNGVVTGRIMTMTGAPGANTGPLIRTVRLVE